MALKPVTEIREDTVLKNHPLYCPTCKRKTLIEVNGLQVTVIKKSDALDAGPQLCGVVLGGVIFKGVLRKQLSIP